MVNLNRHRVVSLTEYYNTEQNWKRCLNEEINIFLSDLCFGNSNSDNNLVERFEVYPANP